MTELERLVVLLAIALQESGVELGRESQALLEVIDTRSESARGYHLSRRGIDALERVDARTQGREVDYRAARAGRADELVAELERD